MIILGLCTTPLSCSGKLRTRTSRDSNRCVVSAQGFSKLGLHFDGRLSKKLFFLSSSFKGIFGNGCARRLKAAATIGTQICRCSIVKESHQTLPLIGRTCTNCSVVCTNQVAIEHFNLTLSHCNSRLTRWMRETCRQLGLRPSMVIHAVWHVPIALV